MDPIWWYFIGITVAVGMYLWVDSHECGRCKEWKSLCRCA